ncbi:hypothetical protein [Mycoplasma sp. CSL10166]|uniref:hypothetical protein n=1 Tax=Mycoplasma sp. CSL10166 TaxID=2813825 RepID=UPI00197B1F2B|nr:hypothetical protein [Mycoplasma sp. CSL10166]MBN4084360.1 hypothetical protein [Mycoplasma sp. CSL10166]
MKKRYKVLLGSSIFATIAITTTSIIMIPQKKKTQNNIIRYIVADNKDPNKVNIDYTTLLINKLADKLTEAQRFIRNNSNLKDNPKIVKLQNKLEDSGEKLSSTIRDNKLITNELEEISKLLNEAREIPKSTEDNGSYYENININNNTNKKDKIINVSLEEAKNNVREELKKAVEDINNIKTTLNDKALEEVSEKANEYIAIANEALEKEDDVNKLQAFLTITLDKKTEVLLSAKKIEKRKEEIKDELLTIKNSLENLNNFFTSNNINLIDGISKYLAFNFSNLDIYDSGNEYIFNFLDFYNKNRKSYADDEITLPRDLVMAKKKMIEFLNKIANDENFVNNIQNVQLKDLENLNQIIENWLFPNYTVDRFSNYNKAIINRFLQYYDNHSRKKLFDNYDKYLSIYSKEQPSNNQNSNVDTTDYTKDTRNSDWMWLDNIKNNKLYSNDEITKNEKNLAETFNFNVILNEIYRFSIEILNKQINKLELFISEKTPNDEITLLDFVEIVYSDEFIKELYGSYKNDITEIIVTPTYNHGEIKEISTYDKFKSYYDNMLKSFKQFASNENKNIKMNIKEIKNSFLESINLYKEKINSNKINLNELNSISSGDFRDLFISSLMWKFNQKLVDLEENKNISDTSKDEGYNQYRNQEENNRTKDEYKYTTYKDWLESKNTEYKNNVLELLSSFKSNINDTVFQDNALLVEGIPPYPRGNKEEANKEETIDIYNNVSKKMLQKTIFDYRENGIDKNFRNNIQNGFDSFVYNLSNQNNNKENLSNLYNYILKAFESKKDFFMNENNKVDVNYNQKNHLDSDNGNDKEKLNFLDFHIKKRFKKLVDLINEKNIKFAILNKKNNFISQNNNLNKLNYLLNKNNFYWTTPFFKPDENLYYVLYSENHIVNYKNFINWKYNNILINYELLYTLVKIADYINSSSFEESKLVEIWNIFRENFDFANKDYEVDYFITQNEFTINDELAKLLNNIE